MTDLQIEIIKHIVNTFCDLAHINNQEVRDNLITRLSSMNEQDVIDYLVVSLGEYRFQIVYFKLEPSIKSWTDCMDHFQKVWAHIRVIQFSWKVKGKNGEIEKDFFEIDNNK